MNIVDIAKATVPEAKHEVVGIRPGEKLHEQMIGSEDALYTYQYDEHYKILPAIHNWSEDPMRIGSGIKVDPTFTYSSDNNSDWMSVEQLQSWIRLNHEHVGKI